MRISTHLTILITITLFGMSNLGYCKTVKPHIAVKTVKVVKQRKVAKDQSAIGGLNKKKRKLKRYARVLKINASAYTISKDETDGDPFITANGGRPVPGKTCAVSRDLRHLMDRHIFVIPENRVLLINDVMNPRYSKSIDIVMRSKKKALNFGRKDLMIVVLD